jgi:hypothetical protein
MVLEGRLSLREASDRMQVSYRHAKRLKGVVARDGPRGLIHGNTGRRPFNAIDLDLGKKILALSRIHTPLLTTLISSKSLLQRKEFESVGRRSGGF